jgi:hypothetical protein
VLPSFLLGISYGERAIFSHRLSGTPVNQQPVSQLMNRSLTSLASVARRYFIASSAPPARKRWAPSLDKFLMAFVLNTYFTWSHVIHVSSTENFLKMFETKSEMSILSSFSMIWDLMSSDILLLKGHLQ